MFGPIFPRKESFGREMTLPRTTDSRMTISMSGSE